MENKKRKALSVAALIVSILPLATLIPTFLKITLSDGVRTACAGANLIFALGGLLLSIICVRKSDSRSAVNIVSAAVSVFWLLLMVGMVVLALLINFLQ